MPLGFIANAPILCAVTNLSLRRALALDRTPWVVRLQKSITINAPVDEIYSRLANPENLSAFSST